MKDVAGEDLMRDRSRAPLVIGWAAFLACSWTWCIGLFLPVLLVRDLGLMGWIIFAIPNVVGAAAMGWVLRTPGDSRRMVDEHRAAAVAFSLATIAFHVFFVAWMLRRLVGPWGPVVTAGLGVMIWGMSGGGAKTPGHEGAKSGDSSLALAGLVLLMSLAAMLGGMRKWLSFPTALPADARQWLDVASLAPVCAFGFLLCPYLDLTFHRTRQNLAGSAGAVGFTLGFGVFFLAIIVFSLGYAAVLAPAVDMARVDGVARSLAVPLGVYMMVQIAFTGAMHARELLPMIRPETRATGLAYAGLVSIVPMLMGTTANLDLRILGLDLGEAMYRGFMGLYGLVFPAYVWLCMVRSAPTRRNLAVLAAAVLLALPFFWLGFIQRQMVMLVPGIAIVLMGRMFVDRRVPQP